MITKIDIRVKQFTGTVHDCVVKVYDDHGYEAKATVTETKSRIVSPSRIDDIKQEEALLIAVATALGYEDPSVILNLDLIGTGHMRNEDVEKEAVSVEFGCKGYTPLSDSYDDGKCDTCANLNDNCPGMEGLPWTL